MRFIIVNGRRIKLDTITDYHARDNDDPKYKGLVQIYVHLSPTEYLTVTRADADNIIKYIDSAVTECGGRIIKQDKQE